MKRREFMQNTAALGVGVGLSTSFSGCQSNQTNNEDQLITKNLEINYQHDLVASPQSHYDNLTEAERSYIDNHFPSLTLSSTPHNHSEDELYIVNHTGASKLNVPQQSKSTSRASNSSTSVTYSYESTTVKDNYAVHMFYKKIIADTNPYVPSSEDDIVQSSPPQYSLAALTLIVPDGTSTDESITFTNAPREIVKALIFSTPAFQHFSRDDLSYALSKFDDIFVGQDISGNTTKVHTRLESAINIIGINNWYYYQAYREKDGTPTFRKTDSMDNNGNTIHKVGDPIYTFPLKESLSTQFSEDLNKVIQYFSADKRLSSQLLPVQSTPTPTQKRVLMMNQPILTRSSTYKGVEYSIDTSSLKGEGVNITLNKVDSDGMHITASNHYNRHVNLNVIYLDEFGNVLYYSDINSFENTTFPDTGAFMTLGTLSPRYALMAIPIIDYIQGFVIPLHEDARTIRLVIGALSFNNGHYIGPLYKTTSSHFVDAQQKKDMARVLTDPEAYTIAFEMAIPALLILWGANLKRDASLNKLFLTLGAKFAYDIASPFFSRPNLHGRDAFLPILANMGTTLLAAKNELAAILIKDIAESETEDSMPIAGQILRAINVAVEVANLSQTIYATSTVRAINIVEISKTHTLSIQLQSDPKDNDFPLNVDSVVITLTLPNTTITIEDSPYTFTWNRNNVVSHSTNGGSTYSTYDIDIDNIPAGEYIDIIVQLKIGNWVAAYAKSEADNNKLDRKSIIIKENLIPIGSNSIYQHYAKLTKSNGSYIWNVKPTNGSFLPSASVSDISSNELLKISVNDPIGAIGYSYKDLNTNQYVVKNISAVLETPNQGTKSISQSNMIQLSYNLLTTDSKDGHLIFERKDGATYVRNVDINSQTTNFNVDFTKNIGKFISDTISQFAYYPEKNILAGLDTDAGVLHILYHLDSLRDDSDTNRYLNAHSTVKTHSIGSDINIDLKTQYMYDPRLLTMSPSGDIVILERTKSDAAYLRAFDQYGTVYLDFPGFNNASGVFEFQQENHSVRYLDISIESKGFIYVLKLLGSDPSNEEAYFLDIYDPTSTTPNTPIVSTPSFSTAKIKVDHWRRVYALNYETTEDNEPTISVWIPPVP